MCVFIISVNLKTVVTAKIAHHCDRKIVFFKTREVDLDGFAFNFQENIKKNVCIGSYFLLQFK